jgi:predicted nucleotidyltransferase
MDMRDEWLRGLRAWASDNGNVRELWLFGSRATGRSHPDSDVDIAVALMPAAGGTDWAPGNYFFIACQMEARTSITVAFCEVF